MSARVKQLTLLLLQTDGRVLLGLKKRGFGAGKFNGFGGKVEPGETLRAAALREMAEEAGVDVLDAALRGHLVFDFVGKDERLEVHVFRATRFTGTPRESDEMAPQWFDEGAIPFGAMWADDRAWVPILLAGAAFEGRFLFDGHDTIIEQSLREVDAVATDDGAVLVTGARQGDITC